MRALAVVWLIAIASLSSGCYDSTWGESKAAQTRNAARSAPAALTALPAASDDEPAAAAPVRARVYRVRVYATPLYQAQTVDYERQIRDLIEEGNRILAPSVGAKLDVESVVTWSDGGPEDDLPRVLAALRAKEPGAGVDWTIAFVGGISKLTQSFHDLGYGDLVGTCIVLRAASLLGERDAIEMAYSELSSDERSRIGQKLKRHRGASILLHEMGHTLGALHESNRRSLMNAHYDARMEGFSAPAIALMRLTLAHRDAPRSPDEEQSFARERLAILEGPSSSTGIPEERTDMVARLRPRASPGPAPAAIAAATPARQEAVLPDDAPTKEPDRAAYKQAVELLRAGDAHHAWEAALPLFKSYAAVYSVQDLRCQIAMQRLGWPGAQADCEPLKKLSTRRP